MSPDLADTIMGITYQTSIVTVIFGNVRVAMAWCETNMGGGHKKGVCRIAGGKDLNSSVVGVQVSRIDSSFWEVFDEVIKQTGAPIFGTIFCIT